jgi:hypothetical protein
VIEELAAENAKLYLEVKRLGWSLHERDGAIWGFVNELDRLRAENAKLRADAKQLADAMDKHIEFSRYLGSDNAKLRAEIDTLRRMNGEIAQAADVAAVNTVINDGPKIPLEALRLPDDWRLAVSVARIPEPEPAKPALPLAALNDRRRIVP